MKKDTKKWTPERRKKFMETLRLKRQVEAAAVEPEPDDPSTVKEALAAIESGVRSLKRVFGIS